MPLPIPQYVKAPCSMIHATFASVSTLLMQVGRPHRPDVVGKGGRGRGMPRCPSIEAMSAVSSPHTNAPAPSRISTVKVKPEPMMSAPSRPRASASAIALVSRLTASGYSART